MKRLRLGGRPQPVACLQCPVDGTDDDGPFGVRWTPFVLGEPCLDFGPAPQGVAGGVRGRRREPARSSLALDWSTDWRLRPVRAATSEAHTSSSGSTCSTSKPSTDSTASMAETTASRRLPASRVNAAKKRSSFAEKVASLQPASTRASSRASVSLPLIVNSKSCSAIVFWFLTVRATVNCPPQCSGMVLRYPRGREDRHLRAVAGATDHAPGVGRTAPAFDDRPTVVAGIAQSLLDWPARVSVGRNAAIVASRRHLSTGLLMGSS